MSSSVYGIGTSESGCLKTSGRCSAGQTHGCPIQAGFLTESQKVCTTCIRTSVKSITGAGVPYVDCRLVLVALLACIRMQQ